MKEKQEIKTPLMKYLEQIDFPIIDKHEKTAISDSKSSITDIKNRKIQYEKFAEKALECLKIAAGYTE